MALVCSPKVQRHAAASWARSRRRCQSGLPAAPACSTATAFVAPASTRRHSNYVWLSNEMTVPCRLGVFESLVKSTATTSPGDLCPPRTHPTYCCTCMYVVVGQLPSCFNSVACPSPPLWVWRIWDLGHGYHPAATYLFGCDKRRDKETADFPSSA